MGVDVLDDAGASVVANGYKPGVTYTVVTTVNVDAGSPSGFGFQLVSLNAPDGQDGPVVNSWSDPADNVQVSTVSSTGRSYAEHKGVSDDGTFNVKWTAPEAGFRDRHLLHLW